MIALLIAAAVALVPGEAISPPLDVTIRQVQTETRGDGRTRRTFRLERSLRFAAETSGFRVAVTTLSADADGAEQRERENYRAANRGLMGRTMIIHVDRAGRVTTIDDLDGHWSAWVEGLVAAQDGGDNAAMKAAMARLARLSDPQRVEMLGGVVAGCIASPGERVVGMERPVSMASAPPFTEITLSGTATSTTIGEHVVNRMAATGSSPDGRVRISLVVSRAVDPRTGLLVTVDRRTTTSSPGATLTVETEQTLSW